LIHRYVEVWEYTDGRIDLQAECRVLPYGEYDRRAPGTKKPRSKSCDFLQGHG
jgi:hypothetical protein